MSHATRFETPLGWVKAMLIHDGYDMKGTVELRAWRPKEGGKFNQPITYFDHEPDLAILLHEDGRVEEKMSAPAGTEERLERELIYRAGVVIGAARLQAKIANVLESHAP